MIQVGSSRFESLCLFVALCLSVLIPAAPALAVDCMWGNGVTDNWNEPSAWSCNQVPGPGDTASQINGTITVSEAASVDSFTMQGGVVTGDADLEILVSMTWTGGTQSGGGKTVIPETATLAIASGGFNAKGLARTLENAGSTTVSHGVSDGGGVFSNLSTGTLDFTADISFARVNNAGTLIKSAGTGTTNTAFFVQTATGSTEVQTGTFALAGTNTIDGSITASGTGFQISDSGPTDILATASITASNLLFTNSTVNLAIGGANFAVDSATFNGGQANFNGPTVIFPNVTIIGSGGLSGSADFEVTGTMNLLQGRVEGTGTLMIPQGSTLSIAPGGSKSFNRNVENAGDTTVTSTLNSGTGTFFNLGTGTLDLAGDFSFNVPIDNAGMLIKSAGAGNSFISPSLTQSETGMTDVQMGTLILQGSCTVDGVFTADGTAVQLNSGGPFAFGGAEIDVSNLSMTGSNIDLSGADSVTIGNFLQNGGSANFDHPRIVITGDFTRTAAGSAFIAGTGKVVFDGGTTQNLSLSRATNFYFVEVTAGTRVIETVEADNGTVDWVLWNRGVIEKTKAVPVSGIVGFGLTGIELDIIDPGTFTFLQVERVGGNHPSAAPGTFSEQHWIMSPTGDGYEVDMTIDHCYQPESDVEVCRYTGSIWDCAVDAATIDSITRLGVTQLDDWTLGFVAPNMFRTGMECGNPGAWTSFIWERGG